METGNASMRQQHDQCISDFESDKTTVVPDEFGYVSMIILGEYNYIFPHFVSFKI